MEQCRPAHHFHIHLRRSWLYLLLEFRRSLQEFLPASLQAWGQLLAPTDLFLRWEVQGLAQILREGGAGAADMRRAVADVPQAG